MSRTTSHPGCSIRPAKPLCGSNFGNKKPGIAPGLVCFLATEVLPQPSVAKPNTPHYEVLSHEFCQSE